MHPILELVGEASGASLNVMRVPLIDKRPFWHYHPEIELTYMAEGQALMQVGNQVATCKAGDLLVLGANLPHDFNPVDSSVRCDFFVVQFRLELLGAFPEMGAVTAFLETAGGGLLLEAAPEEVAGSFKSVDSAGPVHRVGLLFEILARLSATQDLDWQPLSRLAVAQQVAEGRNHQRLQKVIEAILENFHRRISLDEMAALVHMAPPSFSRWFKRTMQMTFVDYLNRVRIEECCRQLRFTGKPVTVIAKDCGFASFSSFNRQFRRLKGCAPRDWRTKQSQCPSVDASRTP